MASSHAPVASPTRPLPARIRRSIRTGRAYAIRRSPRVHRSSTTSYRRRVAQPRRHTRDMSSPHGTRRTGVVAARREKGRFRAILPADAVHAVPGYPAAPRVSRRSSPAARSAGDPPACVLVRVACPDRSTPGARGHRRKRAKCCGFSTSVHTEELRRAAAVRVGASRWPAQTTCARGRPVHAGAGQSGGSCIRRLSRART
jgi:hypothetical protein